MHRCRQHQVRRPEPRVACHRRHRLARRVPVCGAHTRLGGRDGHHGQGVHRIGPDHHSARRRHRVHRRGHPADLEERGHQHRKARNHDRGRAPELARHRSPRAHHLDRGRRGHPAGGRCSRARRVCVCRRPHIGRGLMHWRQHRHECGWQKSRVVGHGPGQLGQLAHGHPRRAVVGSGALVAQPGQDP